MSFYNLVRGRAVFAWALAVLVPAGNAWAQDAAKPLTLPEAMELAHAGSPNLGIADAQVEAARGLQQQAGTGINPQASYTVDNFSGRGAYRGMDTAESTVGLSQQIELGGKREARVDTASRYVDATLVDSRIIEANLDLAVRLRFAELAAAEERLELVKAAVARATRLTSVAQSLVDAGREPPLRLLRAQARTAEVLAELNIAEAQLSAAQRALVALWGGSAEVFDTVGPWEFRRPDEVTLVAPTDTLDYRFAKAEHQIAESTVALEKANAWVDVTVNAGFRRFEATGEQAWVAGITVPIPIQNQNAGNIAAARADDRAAELRLTVALTDAIRKINDARAAFEAADARVSALENEALTQAEEALNLAQIGYEAGRFQLIDVLDAEDAFATIQNAVIAARLARARAAAELLRANAR